MREKSEPRTCRASIGEFLRSTRAGATALTAAVVTVMTVGVSALIADHLWIVDQRDMLKAATDAAGVAATQRMTRLAGEGLTDAQLDTALMPVARRYILLNLSSLSPDRYRKAEESLGITLDIDRDANTVAVTAQADLGGLLFAQSLPLLSGVPKIEHLRATTGLECSGGLVEVVLALDVTASMDAAIDPHRHKNPDNHRIRVAIEAAKTLVKEVYSGCDDTDVAIGVVPWDKTVRVAVPAQWTRNGWVDTSAFAEAASVPGHEPWDGCLADRRHRPGNPKRSDGLSLALPSQAAFPAFMFPDTNRLDPALIEEARRKIFDSFTLDPQLDAGAVDALLRRHSENPWDAARGGPNQHCTWSAMLPLSSDRADVERHLDSLYDTRRSPKLWGGVTMSHLGVTWGRRMLAPTWRTVWGGETHPIDPATRGAGTVTKALVLLTDGQNGAFSDDWGSLPGRLRASYDAGRAELDFGCYTRGGAGCRVLRGDGNFNNEYASRHTAVGRFGEGRAEDGFAVDGRDFSHARTGREARERLKRLMLDSCRLAHDEGIDVYTVSLLPNGRSIGEGWKGQLVACSGNGETPAGERDAYHLEGTDSESVISAFREIGKRLIQVRRTS